MSYVYTVNSPSKATIFRLSESGQLVAHFRIEESGLVPIDVDAIARATVAALNGKTTEPRTVWHPKAVEALRAARDVLGQASTDYGVYELLGEALALVDQPPPAEKVVGWTALDSNGALSPWCWKTLGDCRGVNPSSRIVRLVEEPDQ